MSHNTALIFSRIERMQHANDLITAISEHGRRFFYSQNTQRIACFELSEAGRVFFVDDYSGKKIYTHRSGRWRGFSHGGTLKNLVEQARDYIMKGEKISINYIAPLRLSGDSDIWGYGPEAAAEVVKAVEKMPIIFVSQRG